MGGWRPTPFSWYARVVRIFWKFLIQAAANAAGLLAADLLIPGFDIFPHTFFELRTASLSLAIAPMIQTFAAGGIAFALANTALRPILKVIGAVLPLITFALLSIAWNAVLLFAADLSFDMLSLQGLRALGGASLLIGFLNALF